MSEAAASQAKSVTFDAVQDIVNSSKRR